MATSSSWKLRALMQKNLLIMKRNPCSTIFEIFFPIILLLLCFAIRQAFRLRKHYFEKEDQNKDVYYTNTSAYYGSSYHSPPLNQFGTDSDYELSIIPALNICSPFNDKHEKRPVIASIGLPQSLQQRIINEAGDYANFVHFKEYSSIEEMENVIKDNAYGNDDKEFICFGVYYNKDGHKYKYSLHYFDSMFNQGVQDIPNIMGGVFDQFSSGPDLVSYRKYQKSGYAYILKLINEHILQTETGQTGAKLNFGMLALPYENYRTDPFSSMIGYFIPFFMVIAYMCPLCLYVYRMVGEKENKSKEGMKIMGLTEGTYFLSYFIQYVVITFLNSIVNTIFMSMLFSKTPFYLLFVALYLFALDIFGLIFFFQSFIDKTRVALILSLLIYFCMFFLSMACMDEDANKALKIVLSIFPPVSLELGIILLGKFESHFKVFHASDYTKTYTNYSLLIMNIMQIVDCLLYLFLGYYLQNVLPHDFGIKRPWYFLCTSEYWCPKDKRANSKTKKQINAAINNLENDIKSEEVHIKKENENEQNNNNKESTSTKNNEKAEDKKKQEKKNKKNFESEDLYKDRTKPDDFLQVVNIVKTFGDGKVAVDHVNLKF